MQRDFDAKRATHKLPFGYRRRRSIRIETIAITITLHERSQTILLSDDDAANVHQAVLQEVFSLICYTLIVL